MSTIKYLPVTHVIFDLDGTLIDSEKFLHLAINDVLSQFGKTLEMSLRSQTVGLHMAESAPVIIEQCDLQLDTQQYIQLVLKRFKAYVSGEIGGVGVKFLPGVETLVKHLSKHNVPIAICTGSFNETYQHKVLFYFFFYFEYFFCVLKVFLLFLDQSIWGFFQDRKLFPSFGDCRQ